MIRHIWIKHNLVFLSNTHFLIEPHLGEPIYIYILYSQRLFLVALGFLLTELYNPHSPCCHINYFAFSRILCKWSQTWCHSSVLFTYASTGVCGFWGDGEGMLLKHSWSLKKWNPIERSLGHKQYVLLLLDSGVSDSVDF